MGKLFMLHFYREYFFYKTVFNITDFNIWTIILSVFSSYVYTNYTPVRVLIRIDNKFV